jgi:feruloyl esterase
MTAPFVMTVATNSAPTFTVPGAVSVLPGSSEAHADVRFRHSSRSLAAVGDEWNGKFVGLGNGGLTGAIRHASMVRPLWSGYAVANSDLGHPGSNANFAFGHPEKLIDYAHRADHLTARIRSARCRRSAATYGRSRQFSIRRRCSRRHRTRRVATARRRRRPCGSRGTVRRGDI